MNRRFLTYFILMAVATFASCQQLTQRALYGDIVAKVGDTHLTREELEVVAPNYLKGEDSLAFINNYINRWIKRQIKVDEAERIFSSSVHDVEMMVNSYRQALMTQRLDLYYINSMGTPEIDNAQIQRYYNQHNEIFRLDKNIVKGRILKLPLSHSSESKLKSMMDSSSSDSRLNLISMSEKNQEFELDEFTDRWIDYDDFLGKLPIVRDDKSRAYMKRDGVQRVQDGDWCYLFEVTAYRSAGYVAPLEIVEQRIRQIITSDLQNQMIRENEERLFKAARAQGKIRWSEEKLNISDKSENRDDKRD